jgi:hypothetical protein
MGEAALNDKLASDSVRCFLAEAAHIASRVDQVTDIARYLLNTYLSEPLSIEDFSTDTRRGAVHLPLQTVIKLFEMDEAGWKNLMSDLPYYASVAEYAVILIQAEARRTPALGRRAAATGCTIPRDQVDLLNYHTGGHPYLAEMILCRAWLPQSVSEGASRVLSEIFDYYEHLRGLLAEDQLFDQLLQIAVGPRLSLRSGSVERLLRYGLIRSIRVADESRYMGWSGHFQEYLERCSRDTPLVDLWRDTEVALREIIVDTYFRELGPDWIEVITKRHITLRPMIDGCVDRMNREKKNFGNEASVTVLDYCYPMDLWTLIVAEWNYFSKTLGRTKDYWSQRFSHLAKVRTPTAHNRQFVLPAHEIKLGQAYCEEVLARLRG